MLKLNAIKTNLYKKNYNLSDFICENLREYNLEGKILAITSKIVSISENRFILKKTIKKDQLIKNESDIYIGKTIYDVHLTIKNNLLIPSAGIDESNVDENYYLLYPVDPYQSVIDIYYQLKSKLNLKNFGLILTDSKTMPLKRGVTGTSLSHFGFKGLKNKVGCKDLFGNELKYTHINTAEALATAATFLMGEGDESKPLAIIETSDIAFHEDKAQQEQQISVDEDLYSLLLKPFL